MWDSILDTHTHTAVEFEHWVLESIYHVEFEHWVFDPICHVEFGHWVFESIYHVEFGHWVFDPIYHVEFEHWLFESIYHVEFEHWVLESIYHIEFEHWVFIVNLAFIVLIPSLNVIWNWEHNRTLTWEKKKTLDHYLRRAKGLLHFPYTRLIIFK